MLHHSSSRSPRNRSSRQSSPSRASAIHRGLSALRSGIGGFSPDFFGREGQPPIANRLNVVASDQEPLPSANNVSPGGSSRRSDSSNLLDRGFLGSPGIGLIDESSLESNGGDVEPSPSWDSFNQAMASSKGSESGQNSRDGDEFDDTYRDSNPRLPRQRPPSHRRRSRHSSHGNKSRSNRFSALDDDDVDGFGHGFGRDGRA
eukprot:scaffold6172_cov42-Cyclotella_meneghiniana.AAC.1